MRIYGTVYPRLVEETRLKPGFIRTAIGNVNNLAALKRAKKTYYHLLPTDNEAPNNTD